MKLYRFVTAILIYALAANAVAAGLNVFRSNGISVTSANGVTVTGTDGVTVTGTDGLLSYRVNGITVTGTDGVTITGTDGVTISGADGAAYVGTDGVTVSGADGVTVSGADGVTVTGTDGITVTGTDGTVYSADSIIARTSDGVTVTGTDGVTVSGADGVTVTGTDGVTVSGADGVTVTGTDGVSISGADSITGFDLNGVVFELTSPAGVTVSGADGVSVTGADGVTVSGADGITVTGTDSGSVQSVGLQSIDAELALKLNEITDDSNVNAVVVYYSTPTEEDLNELRTIGIMGGTRFVHLPFVYVTATRSQMIALSRFPNVRSIYGNRTLNPDSDPYFRPTQIERVRTDADLTYENSGMPVSGRNVTVAVLDTGVNSQHADLAGRVVQNVRLVDVQSAPAGFISPVNVENVPNTDPVNGHGTFVAGIIAGSGAASGGKFGGVAPGANILGLSAGDLSLIQILAGFDYLLEKGGSYNVGAVNCSFSANTVYDPHDPVNIATKLTTDSGISVIFSAGNSGSGNGTLNPYASAPWVISVAATDQRSRLAPFSSRGRFGNAESRPSVAAPGVNVVSLRSGPTQTGVLGIAAGGDQSRLNPSELAYYTTASGTSFSAPQAAGAVALMLEANPGLSPQEIKEILQRSSTPLVNYYGHEVGAGLLNTYAAVLEAAFPDRRTGLFRAVLGKSGVAFRSRVILGIDGTASPGIPSFIDLAMPPDTVQADIGIHWGGLLSPNDLGLKVFGADGSIVAESNYLNVPGLTGRREKVLLRDPAFSAVRLKVSNTLPVGTPQTFLGSATITTATYPAMNDVGSLAPSERGFVLEALRSFQIDVRGNMFFPSHQVTREELALTMVRSGFVPQFIAAEPVYSDVRNLTGRTGVESAYNSPFGSLIYDSEPGGRFRPNESAAKLTAAVAFVKAAGLDSAAAGAVLSPALNDASSIPAALRGYVAVALQYGFLSAEGNRFNKDRPVTRLELAIALVRIKRLL